MATFTIKRGDTAPAIRYSLLPETVDLAGASVVFVLAGDRLPATVVSTAPPVVEYSWQPEDTASPGLRRAEFEITYQDGRIETFPNGEYLLVHVVADLG